MRLIAAATAEFEGIINAPLVQRTYRLELDTFPTWELDLQAYPISSITSIKYDDVNNTEQTMVPNTDYYESLSGSYPSVYPVTYWPYTYCNKPAAVRIVMVGGYAPSGSPLNYGANVPEDIKQAILVRLYDFWNQPGEQVQGLTTSLKTVECIANKYRRIR